MIKGILTEPSPLRCIFPDGIVPLTSPQPQMAILGAAPPPQEVYMLALKQCTAEQLDRLAERMSVMGQGPVAEARQHVGTAAELPLRAFHFCSIQIPLAAFI